jgi:hypothetical protein
MAMLRNISRSGTIHGRTILHAFMSYIALPNITIPINSMLIEFYTMSDNFIDSISSFSESVTKIGIEFTDDILGGLKDFKLSLNRDFSVQIFDQMIVKLFLNNINWWVGMIKVKPTMDNTNQIIDYAGVGLIEQLGKEEINLVYENTTVKAILDDLFGVQMLTTDIFFDSSKLVPPDIAIVKLEFNNKSLLDALDTLLEICNVDFNNEEYRYYIDADRFINFSVIDKNIIIDSFFEGYDYQSPGVTVNSGKIVNEVKIFRTQEDSQVVELVDTVNDTDSIANYGLGSKKITITDYADIDDATYIARAQIERYKEPYKTVKLSDIIRLASLEFGVYRVNNAIQNYTTLISDFNKLSDWNMYITDTVISLETYNVQSGRNCFKIETHAGSSGEYIEYVLPEIFNFPEYLDLWLRQDTTGMFIFFQMLDENGHTTQYSTTQIISETGLRIISETGIPIIAENGASGIQVNLIQQFNKYSIPIDTKQIKTLAKIRISFLTDAENTIYLDRLEIRSRQYMSSDLVMRKIKYKMEKGIFTADPTLGEPAKSGVDNIKELNQETKNIQGIFTKS